MVKPLFLFLSLCGPTVYLLAADYYFCDCAAEADPDCIQGDDAAAGTADDPWRSYEKAQAVFATLQPGDALHFARGGSWEVTSGVTRWTNNDCEAGNPCVVSDYAPPWGSGDEDRPLLLRADGADGFALEDGGPADHEEGYLFENLELRGTGTGKGFFIYNDVDDIELRNLVIRDFDIGINLAGANPCGPDPACDGLNERITLSNSTIVDNESMGWLGSGSWVQILDNYFENNGTTPVFDHNIYISGVTDTQGMVISGNTSYRSTQRGTGICQAAPLVIHGVHRDMIIENNLILEEVGAADEGCWGIAVDNGYVSAPEAFTNIVIRANTIKNVGNIAIGLGSCVQCLVENNIIIQDQPYYSIGISAPDRPLNAGDAEQDSIHVRNNSLYFGNEAGGTGIEVNEMGSNHLIVGNAILYEGSRHNFNGIRATLASSAYTAVDYNLFFFPNAPSAEWSDTFGNLAAWQASSGFDINSVHADPGFSDPAAGNLYPASGTSSIVDLGAGPHFAGEDARGIPRDARPDAGAYEWRAYNLPCEYWPALYDVRGLLSFIPMQKGI